MTRSPASKRSRPRLRTGVHMWRRMSALTRCRKTERGEFSEEGKAPGLVERREPFEEETAEETRQHAHGQEEAGPAGDPARSKQA